MLNAVDEVCELIDVATLVNDTRLIDDATTIECLVYKVSGNTEELNTIVHRVLNSMCTLERWQQRWVDVDNATLIALKQHLTHDAHIASKADKVYATLIEHRSQHCLIRLARLILLGVKGEALCAVALSALKHISTGLVAYQEYYLGIDKTLATRLSNGLIVTTTAAGEYGQTCLSHNLR